MEKTRYAHYNINYHLVWIPKYRKRILVGGVNKTLDNALRNASKDIEILSSNIQPDHVHIFVSAPPRMSPAQVVNILKGVGARRIGQKYPHLRTKKGIWTRTYYIGTAGKVSAETIKRYIEECQKE